MGASVFFQGTDEIATLTNTFSVAGVLTDPTTVTLTVTDPTGTPTTYTWPTPATITHSSTGVFTKDVPCATAGTWQYVWTGTGAAADVTSGTWEVQETQLGRLYCTVEALKSRMGITGSADDYELHAACFAASRQIEHECGRHFWRTTAAEIRTFIPADLYTLRLPGFNDLVSVAALKTDNTGTGTYDTTWSASDYQLWPVNPAAAPESRPYTRVLAVGTQTFPLVFGALLRADRVQITGVFGWPAVPRGIKMAAAILAHDTFKLKDAPFGVAGFGDFGPQRVGTNRAADRYLAPYRRDPVLVA